MKSIIILVSILVIVNVAKPQQESSGPFSEGVFFQDPTLCGDWPATPYDWDGVYHRNYPLNWFLTGVDPNEVQYLMSYFEMRYNLSAMLFMYKTTKDPTYLAEFVDQADSAFNNENWYKDGDNGCDDGFLGWGMRRSANPFWGPMYLGQTLDQNTWYHVKVRVQDTLVLGVTRTRIQAWFENQSFEGYLPSTPVYPAGTIALSSGWAKSRFKNITVRTLPDYSVFYDLNTSGGTFSQDWSKVKNQDVVNYPNDTGDWSLIITENNEVVCDATLNDPGPFYYPYDPSNPIHHGKLPNGTGSGKYAALVLVRSGATSLVNYEIEFDVLIEKRNQFQSDVGLGVRWHASSTLRLTDGNRQTWHARYAYFTHRAKWLSVYLRPHFLELINYSGPVPNTATGYLYDSLYNFALGTLNWDGAGTQFLTTRSPDNSCSLPLS